MKNQDQPSNQNHSSPDVERLGKLISGIRIAMLTTLNDDGTLHSRPMATQETEFDGELWFFTAEHSEKCRNIRARPTVNVAYSNPQDNRYLAISGRGEIIKDPAKAKALWNPLLKAWFPKGLEDPELTLLKIKVEQAEYWDTPSSTAVQVYGFLKAVVTGKPYQKDKEQDDQPKKIDLAG